MAGTVQAAPLPHSFRIESPKPDDAIFKIIRLAKQGCFAEQMVQAAVPLSSTYEVNGVAVDVGLNGEVPTQLD